MIPNIDKIKYLVCCPSAITPVARGEQPDVRQNNGKHGRREGRMKEKKQNKRSINALNDTLFAQLDRLNDDSLTDEQKDMEIRRADGICKISSQILKSAELAYKTMIHMDQYGLNKSGSIPAVLECGDDE